MEEFLTNAAVETFTFQILVVQELCLRKYCLFSYYSIKSNLIRKNEKTDWVSIFLINFNSFSSAFNIEIKKDRQ